MLTRGLEAIELTEPVDLSRRCDVLLELGDLEQWLSASPAVFQELGKRAAGDARRLGSGARLARAAAIAFYPVVGAPDEQGSALVEEALALLGDEDTDLRVQLLVRLAQYRIESEARWDDGLALAEEGLALAERASPNVAAIAALTTWLGLRLRPVDEVLAAVEAVPEDQRSPLLLSFALRVKAVSSLDAGDLAAFDASLTALRELADTTRGWQPRFFLVANAITRSLLHGDWEAAEHAVAELLVLAADDLDSVNIWAGFQIALMRDRGRLEDLLPLVDGAQQMNPGVAAFRTALALVQAGLGHLETAKQTLAPVAGDRVSDIPSGQVLGVTLATLAEAAATLGDLDTCAAVSARLVDFPDRLIAVGGYMHMGPVDRYLGILAAALGRFDDAERHFEVAVDIETRLGARPWLVRTHLWFARMLVARAGPGDGDRATSMLDGALAEAEHLGMVSAAAEIRELLA
ncbi:MAG: hypothetical protein ACT4OV_15535 [Microthrixaceae bacterium]